MARAFRILFIALVSVLQMGHALAQGSSYVYIQGDKQLPFYVKMYGEMLPRYGKNYCIISELAAGPINIEILFQQNAFPAEKFTIQVPENGSRGFLLMKRDNVYALYDIQQQFYLQPGNKAEEDHLSPVLDAAIDMNAAPPPIPVAEDRPMPKIKIAATKKKPAKPVRKPRAIPTDTADHGPVGPDFMPDVELNNANTVKTETTIPTSSTKNKVAVANSDCPKAISSDQLENMQHKAQNKNNINRLKYLLEQMDNCFTTFQARRLAKTLDSDPERFTFLKNIYPRITDQSVFHNLEDLLSSYEWKNYFREMLK